MNLINHIHVFSISCIGRITWLGAFFLEIEDTNIAISETNNNHVNVLRMNVDTHDTAGGGADKLRE